MGDIFEILKEKLAVKSEKVGGGGRCIYWKGGFVEMVMGF